VAPAAAASITVHVVDCPGATVDGEHVKEETGTPLTLPPLPAPLLVPPPPLAEPRPAKESVLPVGSTPSAPLRVAVVLTTPGASTMFTVATTPFVMILEFMPLATQLNRPKFIVQFTVFPAVVKEGPAVALATNTSVPGKAMAQSTPAGSEPAGEEMERVTVRMPPPLLPGDNVSVSDCP